jgi:outer membrane protein assembly factor BamD (BamD/ComL family)
MYVLSAAMVLVLVVTGIGSLTFASPLHGIQASTLERNGQWADAIREYSYAGQGAPNAPDIARVYDEWGEQLLGQRSLGLAVSRFDTVVTQYSQSGSAYDRGRTDLYNAYKEWIGTQGTDVPYPDAITYFETYAGFSTCDSTCQVDAHTIEAQARFQYGTQLAASSNYADAITQFEAIQKQFPQSPYASQAHTAAATAYYAEGQADLSGSSCANALTAYKTLVSNYGDTPEGQKAKTALAAGVDVTGTIPSAPGAIPVFLSKHVDPTNFIFSSEYRSTLGTNGSFTFHGVQSGDYNLATSHDTGTAINFVYWHDASGNLYFIHVGQLCPVQVNDLQSYPPNS